MHLFRQAFKPSCSFRYFILIPKLDYRSVRDPNNIIMKKLFVLISAALVSLGVYAQDAQSAAAAAAKTISEAPEVATEVVKPDYWTKSLKTNVNIGESSLTNWAAGGDNTVSLAAYVDGNANWKKNEMFWNNRLQLDYGFLYASSKPILQKNMDRIYLESKWGYKAPSTKYLYFSANFDFRSQFTDTWDYATPTSRADGNPFEEGQKPVREDWLAAKVLKSGFLSPAYTNLALGIDFVPSKWFSLNFAPITGGFVIVTTPELRKTYAMNEKSTTTEDMIAAAGDNAVALGKLYNPAKFEFGAQLKMDAKVNVNDNFAYSTQVVLFANYLDINHCPRINWDNRFDWKLAKYFSLTLATNLIYDDTILITTEKYPEGKKGLVQFKQSLAFGFTYTIASKK